MSYTPTTWANGDTITAVKLNNMESGIEDAQNGWSVEGTQYFSETVTTTEGYGGFNSGALAYAEILSTSPLTVTFNGTEYTCTVTDSDGDYLYGDVGENGPDFTNYPFVLTFGQYGEGSTLYTETAGTYTVAAGTSSVTTTADFQKAANNAVDTSTMPMLCVSGTTTYGEMNAAKDAGKLLYFYNNSCFLITAVNSSLVTFYPSDASTTASFDGDGIFTVTIS